MLQLLIGTEACHVAFARHPEFLAFYPVACAPYDRRTISIFNFLGDPEEFKYQQAIISTTFTATVHNCHKKMLKAAECLLYACVCN